MKILKPCEPFFITQSYGAKSPAYTSYHHGTDLRIRNVPEKAIRCVYDGIVESVHIDTVEQWYTDGIKNKNYGVGSAYGVHIIVKHKIDGNDYFTLYGHLEQAYVNKGQTLKAGEIIGKGGSTGKSTAPHLHFELRKGKNTYASAISAEPFFADSLGDEIPEWGREAWEWGKANGILSDKSVFDAQMTKGELAVFLYRFSKIR